MSTNDFVDVVVKDGTASVSNGDIFAPLAVSINGNVCSVYVNAPNGKPIATLKVINKETGEEIPVNVSTCTEAVVCADGKTTQHHLEVLYIHANDEGIHLTPNQKAEFESKTGAQQKASTAKTEAIAAASLLVATAKTEAANDATQKANAAREAAIKHANDGLNGHIENKSNPHNVTAAQVGLGNVPNKSTNDLQPTYTEASTLTSLSSGEKLSVAFGKIAKTVVDLIAHIGNKSNPHAVTASQAGALPKTGGTLTGSLTLEGNLILKEGVHYGDTLPEPGIPGRIFFKKVSS